MPDAADITYLARDMLPGEQRTPKAISAALPPPSTATPAVAAAGGAAIAGHLVRSRTGVGTAVYGAAGLEIALAILGGGEKPAHPDIGGIILPHAIDGQVLATSDEARHFVRDDNRRNVEEFGRRVGRTVTCIDQCDSNYPTYELRKDGVQAFPDYDPPSLFLTLYLRPLIDAKKVENPVINQIVAFEAAWITSPLMPWADNYVVCLDDQAPAGDHVKIHGETIAANRCSSRFTHPLERILLRTLTASGRYYFGSQSAGIFAWHGRLFALGEPAPATLIDYEIPPETN